MAARRKRGFTLVELLVVITIIGILIALLMPAVQAVRESGRRTQCSNNLKNLALGCSRHLEVHSFFPTGGWGCTWPGLPDQGYDINQPGGWIYNVLAFIEQDALHDLGKTGATALMSRSAGSAERIRTPLKLLHCPTRRRVQTYPLGDNAPTMKETDSVNEVARTDYAINGGIAPLMHGDGPSDLTSGATQAGPDTSSCVGISYVRSMVRSEKIIDGLSNTYLVGEKYIDPENYYTGNDPGDKNNAYSGSDTDVIRWGNRSLLPQRDQSNVGGSTTFGSAHASGCNFAFCDGSIHFISYGIDPVTHEYLMNRADGFAVDPSKY